MPTRVEIIDYSPLWPDHFNEASQRLAALLGQDPIDFHHVGSTAVPGLAAKPLIDIDIITHSVKDIPTASVRLVSAGYEPRGSRHGDGVFAFLLRGNPGERIYLCPPDSETHRKRIIFRDRLRADKALATRYEDLKWKLAAEFPLEGDAYTAAKSEFIHRIVEKITI